MIKKLISDIDGIIYEYESNKKIVIERLWGYCREHLCPSREVYQEALGDGMKNCHSTGETELLRAPQSRAFWSLWNR